MTQFGTMRAQAALREAEQHYRMVVEWCPDAILIYEDATIIFANPAAIALLGAADAGQVRSWPLSHFMDSDCVLPASAEGKDTLLRKEETIVRLDGSEVVVDVHATCFTHDGRSAVLLIMRDITERKKTAEELTYLAYYDSLTGLPNRTLFHQRLAHALSIAERPGRSIEILFLDLDQFKEINDTSGHAAGDAVLRETAQRLQSILRGSDTVARLGGDEFVILVENVDEPHRGATIAGKILASLTPPFLCEKEPKQISASIGISTFPGDGADADTLLGKADVAMYRAKQSGRNSYRYYCAEMNLHMAERLSLERALASAIERRQLVLHYQPKLDVSSRRITGMEALLRWHHPELGWLAPEKFIRLAEETGLITAIGAWVIETACLQNKRWQEAGAHHLQVSVNLAPQQLLDRNFIASLRTMLDDTRLDSRYLGLEITENAAMVDPEKAVRMLHALAELGVSVAIDNFGIGRSSLAWLKRFPVRALKIDHSFVHGAPQNHADAAITKAIIGMGHRLGCNVIAEGTETSEQFEFLRDNECDCVQGFYFGEPLCAERFYERWCAQPGTAAGLQDAKPRMQRDIQ